MRCSKFSRIRSKEHRGRIRAHFCMFDAMRISLRSNFISLLADDKASRHRKRRRAKEPCDRNCVVISPRGGGGGEEPMAARELCGDGWAAVWKNCSSFATVFRSSVPSTVFHAPLCFAKRPRRRLAGPPVCCRSLFMLPLHPSTRKRASTIRRTFRYYRFSADERSGNDGRADHRKKHPALSSSNVLQVVATGKSSYAVRLRSTFFLSRSLAAVLFMPAPLLPPDRRRLPKRSCTFRRETIVVSYSIYLTSLAGKTFSCNIQ